SNSAALKFVFLSHYLFRLDQAGKLVIECLKLFVTEGCSSLVRERMAHLNFGAAKWQLYELEERGEELKRIEISDRGNVSTRLVRCPDETEILARFAAPVALVEALMPEVEVGV